MMFRHGRVLHIALLVLGGPGVTGALAQATEKAPAATTMQMRLKAPEPAKWNIERDQKTGRTTYNCKPLACPDSLRVVVTASRSPTRDPDPQALEKLANVDLPKAVRAASAAREVISDGAEKIETLVSRTDSLHGYPAVVNETKYSKGASAVFKGTAMIFAGPALIRVEAMSPNHALAQKSLAEFIAGMTFESLPAAPAKPGKQTI